jgi:hypothetical protein
MGMRITYRGHTYTVNSELEIVALVASLNTLELLAA